LPQRGHAMPAACRAAASAARQASSAPKRCSNAVHHQPHVMLDFVRKLNCPTSDDQGEPDVAGSFAG
jgi:hypothetical protein